MAICPQSAANPLLSQTYLPNKALPFDRIKPEHFEPAILEGIKQHAREIKAIADNAEAATFANTIEALEFSGALLDRAMSAFGAVLGTKKTDELSNIQKKLQPALSAHGASVTMNDRLFARVKAVYDARATLSLDDEQKVLLEKTYKSFEASGAALPPAQKKRLQEISLELSKLSTQYSENVMKSTVAWRKVITDENELDGVPQRAKDAYKDAAKAAGMADGSFLLTLAPYPGEVMSHGTNRALREEVFKASGSIGYGGPYDNRPVIMDIVKLRHEKAQIMGHQTYAGMVLAGRMAGSTQVVEDFLAKNAATYTAAAKAEAQIIKDLAAAEGMTDLKPWDVAFYSRKVQERDYQFNSEELRPYFEMDRVVAGLFAHAEKLFNIGFTAADGKYPVYDPDMKVYEVHDKKDGSLVGVFYTDYYARPGEKREGAWMNAFQNAGVAPDGLKQVPHVINVCNFAKPAKGKATLLSVGDVTTMYHEFGHGLHGLLGKGKYPSLTGTNVKWDFVELPSQLQENWVLEKKVLDSFAVHYQTGAKMPQDLVRKLRAVNNYGAAGMGQRQTFLGMLDMAWHNTDPATLKSVEDVEIKAATLAGTFNKAAGLNGAMSTRFGHIFSGGYSAGYYSYKWAEVLEADIFETKFKGKLYNRKNADELREKIYAAGGTRPPMDLFVDYMGRQPDPDALFRREGLTPVAAAKTAEPAPQKKAPPPPAPGV
jgi:peptidyl-dipeptidase Dcp